MKYYFPSIPFVLIGPHKSVCTNSSVFFMECSLFLNSTLVSFSHWHYTHSVWRICNFRHIPYNSFLLSFTILSKCVCPNILWQSQLWFSFLEQHLSLLISFRMYMSFGVLIVVATNFLKSFFPYFTLFWIEYKCVSLITYFSNTYQNMLRIFNR